MSWLQANKFCRILREGYKLRFFQSSTEPSHLPDPGASILDSLETVKFQIQIQVHPKFFCRRSLRFPFKSQQTAKQFTIKNWASRSKFRCRFFICVNKTWLCRWKCLRRFNRLRHRYLILFWGTELLDHDLCKLFLGHRCFYSDKEFNFITTTENYKSIHNELSAGPIKWNEMWLNVLFCLGTIPVMQRSKNNRKLYIYVFKKGGILTLPIEPWCFLLKRRFTCRCF